MRENKNIRMRLYKGSNPNPICQTCGSDRNHCLDMFELCFVGAETHKKAKLTLCDNCVDVLFIKTLKSTTYVNGRLKSQHDIAIKNQRGTKDFIKQYGKQKHIPINPPEKDEWDEVMEEFEED